MEDNTGPILGGVGIALSVLTMIFTAINHKKVKAKCCNKVIEMSLDVDSTNRNSVKIHPEASSEPSGQPKVVVVTH